MEPATTTAQLLEEYLQRLPRGLASYPQALSKASVPKIWAAGFDRGRLLANLPAEARNALDAPVSSTKTRLEWTATIASPAYLLPTLIARCYATAFEAMLEASGARVATTLVDVQPSIAEFRVRVVDLPASDIE